MLAAGLGPHLGRLLREGSDDVRLAAVWTVINLTSAGEARPGAAKRVAALREACVSAVSRPALGSPRVHTFLNFCFVHSCLGSSTVMREMWKCREGRRCLPPGTLCKLMSLPDWQGFVI